MMTLKFVYVRVDTILTIIVVMFLSKCFSSIEPLKYFSHVLFHYGQIHNHTWNSPRFTLRFRLGFGSKIENNNMRNKLFYFTATRSK